VNLDLDLDPITVGFDLRRHDIAVRLPEGDVLSVRYAVGALGEPSKLKTITSTRTRVRATLELHGYNVLDPSESEGAP